MKRISIIVPVYNKGNSIRNCLNSILNQKYSNIEVILIDDGSNDNSGQVCKEYALKDKRLHYFYQKNSGVSSARNLGLKKITGEYVHFLDADDWIESDIYSKNTIYINELNIDIIIFNYMHRYNKASDDFETILNLPKNQVLRKKEMFERVFNSVLSGQIHGCGNKLFSRRIIEGVLMDESLSYGEDLVYQLPLFDKAESMIYVPEPYYNYNHKHEGSLTKKFVEESISKTYLPIFNIRKKYSVLWSVKDKSYVHNFLIYVISDINRSFEHYDSFLRYRKYLKYEVFGTDEIIEVAASYKNIKANFTFYQRICLELINIGSPMLLILCLYLRNVVKLNSNKNEYK